MAIIPDPSGDAPLTPYVNYDEIGTVAGVTSYQFYITGAGTSNYSSRTIRYKLDNDEWTYSMNHSFVREDSTTRLELSRPQGKTLTVEAWTTDEMSMLDSPATTVVIADNEIYRNNIYIPVSSQTKRIKKLYASINNYFNPLKQITRSAAGIEISTSGIKITKNSTGSGGYTYAIFPIDETNELIGKRVNLTGEFTTSGSFTSGARLWWLNSTNTGILSGPVASIEYIGNAGKFSKTGIIPQRPSNAGNLALLLYANIASQGQGVYSVFNKVNLKLEKRNLFDYYKTNYPTTKSGVTVSLNNEEFTCSGILSANYPVFNAYEIQDELYDGQPVVMSQTTPSSYFYMQMPIRNKSSSTYSYPSLSSNYAVAVNIDKTVNDIHKVQFQCGTTSAWGTGSRTITQKFQLERGMNLQENIINILNVGSGSSNGLSWSTSGNGYITITGTASANTHIYMNYTLDSSMLDSIISHYYIGKVTGINNMSLKKGTSDVSGLGTLTSIYCGRTFKVSQTMIDNVSRYDIYITSGSVVNAKFYYGVQVGSLAHDFAPRVKTYNKRIKKLYVSANGETKLIYRK